MEEEIKYGIKTAGHESPQPERAYEKPDSRLANMFEEWLTFAPNLITTAYPKNMRILYMSTEWGLKFVDTTIEQAHGLLHVYKDHPWICHAGIFLSAIYNVNKEKVIVFDISIPELVSLASFLDSSKVFINLGSIGEECGHNSKGLVINLNKTSRLLGAYHAGVVINYGETDDIIGHRQIDDGILVNCGKTKDKPGNIAQGHIIDFRKDQEYDRSFSYCKIMQPGKQNLSVLKKYFDDLKQRILARDFEGVDKEQVKKDIERIVKEEGYKWQSK